MLTPLSGHRLLRSGMIALAGAALLTACGKDRKPSPVSQAPASTYSAEIRRTAYGIPHIKAADEAGLGYGIGYAYAEDNLCLLANEVLTVNGERSRHFGADGRISDLPGAIDNLTSDYIFRLMNDAASIDAAWQAQPAPMRALIRGYVAGVNRYLARTPAAKRPAACRDGAWVRPLTERDVLKLVRRLALLHTSMAVFAGFVTAPPTAEALPTAVSGAPRPQRARRVTGSNAVALGREATGGGGMLLGQPHLPWVDMLRFYQMHLTIPGKLDVMGATVTGLPAVSIGFNRDLAWTHTTDTSAHATLYALRLDPGDPTRYIVDGRVRTMTRRAIQVEVRRPDGRLGVESRDFYLSDFGPVLSLPEEGMAWTRTTAYALRDANADNHRLLELWFSMGRASSLAELQAINRRLVANPWNTTVAADRAGRTLYLNIAPIPNLPADRFADCRQPEQPLQMLSLFVLAGDRGDCGWIVDPRAPQPGIFPGDALPALHRDDYVQNANDSAWLSQPAAPLTGFSPVISQDSVPQGARTRLGLSRLEEWLRGGRLLTLEDLQTLALDNRVYLAELLLDDVLALCRLPAEDGTPADLSAACARLAAWDRRVDLDSGLGYFDFGGLMNRLAGQDDIWSTPFDPADPVNTPRGLRLEDASVRARLRQALAESARDVASAGWPADARLGDIQVSRRAGRTIPIHGGDGELGIYNALDSRDTADGLREAFVGSTYIQAVAFDAGGPRARTLLTYSQSADPDSPHHADQTQLFSDKAWVELPFSEAQIQADRGLRRLVIAE